MKTIALFNSRSGVGKSFLTYHLAWMFHHLDVRVVVVDLDPQTHLTGAFLEDERYEQLAVMQPPQTIVGAIEAVDQHNPSGSPIEDIDGIGLIPGDVALAGWENRFAMAWQRCLDDQLAQFEAALRLTTSIDAIAKRVAHGRCADVVLLDMGPGLGAINRATLLAADAVIIPIANDVPSRLVLPTVGRALADWRAEWAERRGSRHAVGLPLPVGAMPTIGYVVVHHADSMKRDVPATSVSRQMARAFHEEIVGDSAPVGSDPWCLASLRHLRGLLNLHLEARKPVFDLKAADGAIGSYAMAVKDAYVAFENLAREIAARAGIALPERD